MFFLYIEDEVPHFETMKWPARLMHVRAAVDLLLKNFRHISDAELTTLSQNEITICCHCFCGRG